MKTKIQVAIAEDHNTIRQSIIELIEEFGDFKVVLDAENGQELYTKLLQAKSLPDVVILDVGMPVWDGYQTLTAIRAKWQDLKVLVFTMYKHEFAIVQMFKMGVNGYILKNSPPQELKHALISVHETGFYFSSASSLSLYHQLQHSSLTQSLTDKEMQLLRFCHTDLTYKEIADKMKVSEATLGNCRVSLFEKLKVKSRAGLVLCELEMGLKPFAT